MPTIGLFTRQDARAPKKPARSADLPAERCWELGEKGVAHMNPGARSPHMKPTGKPGGFYVLGEAPGEDEDKLSRQFIGRSGDLLRNQVPESAVVMWDNCCRTRPVKGTANRPPTFHEIECYRPSVIKSIEEAKPHTILGFGQVPLNWMFDTGFRIGVARGRRFPVKVGTHACWFYPVHHPSFILRAREDPGGRGKPPGKEYEIDFQRDLASAFAGGPMAPPPPVVDPATLFDDVTCTHDPVVVKRWFRKVAERGKTISYDYETNVTSPYASGAKALSIALTDSKYGTLSFPIAHPGARWASGSDQSACVGAFEEFMLGGRCRMISHSSFDLEWSAHLFGYKVLRNRTYGCTMAQAYNIDEREGGFSLDFLTCQYFGFRIKKHSLVNRAKLEDEGAYRDWSEDGAWKQDINKVLRYGGGDSKWTLPLFWLQNSTLKARDQLDSYNEFVDRLPSIVLAQSEGLPIDKAEVRKQSQELKGRVEKVEADFQADETVKKYCQRFGALDPASPNQLAVFFRDFLRRPEGVRGTKYSTDEDVLAQMKDVPAAKLVLEYRKVTNIKTKYVDALDREAEKNHVFPDGRLHAQFKYVSTDTGRLSIEKPSLQNFPIRKDAWVRKTVAPGGQMVVVCIDEAQLEYRGYAMATQDKLLVESCWTGFDVHGWWAQRIREANPKTYDDRYAGLDEEKGMKKFRSDVKNEWVFPALYKAGWRSRGRSLDLPDEVARELDREMWKKMPDVKAWHDKKMREYEEHRYVTYMSGRRRHAPMNVNMIVNAPVQGDMSEIICNAWNRLNKIALETERPWVSPDVNLHDDLSFFWVRERDVSELIKVAVKEMVLCPFKWAQSVPLGVEVKVGPSWGEVKEIGKYASHQVPGFKLYTEAA